MENFKLEKDDMIKYLKQINDELKRENETGEILISGGASMCLVHEARPSTKDIDAIFEPKSRINQIAEKIAQDNNLDSGWINDGVKGFLHPEMKQEVVYDFGNLKVSTVSAEALLTMKLIALRAGSSDRDDAKFLIKKLNITDGDALLQIMTENTYKEKLSVMIQYLALDVLSEVNSEREKERKRPSIKEKIDEIREKSKPDKKKDLSNKKQQREER